MIIAVSCEYESGDIAPVFDETKHFKVYETDGGEVRYSEIVGTMGCEVLRLPEMLTMLEADILICGAISLEARASVHEEGVQLFAGCSGNSDEAIQALFDGSLDYDADFQ